MLERYAAFHDDDFLSSLRRRGRRLAEYNILTVNTAKEGGGVAQILQSLVPLLQDTGVNVDWKVLDANHGFFEITKRLHNGLQGEDISLPEKERRHYRRENERFWSSVSADYDFVVVHDPQPCAGIRTLESPAALRIHVDASHPSPQTVDFLKGFVDDYDEVMVSKEAYYPDKFTAPHRVVHPATDPFTAINKDMSQERATTLLHERVGSYDNIVTQVSRFDKWKDPIGVIEVFERVREQREAGLLLLGSDAADDPEGMKVYEDVCERARRSPYGEDITVIMENNAELVNAAQRASDVVVQKSLREGFGLTVSEAMLKEAPVVASDVGGIPCQITHGETGFLHEPDAYDEFARTVATLLDDESLQSRVGERAARAVMDEFLMTRLLDDYLSLFEDHLL